MADRSFVIINSVILVLVLISCCRAVDRNNFKKCDQSSFCKRNRARSPGQSPYQVIRESLQLTDLSVEVHVKNTDSNVSLKLKLTILDKSTARFQIDELNPIRPRYHVEAALVGEPTVISYEKVKEDDESLHIKSGTMAVVLTYNPFRLDFMTNNEVAVSINSRGLFNFEHYRLKKSEPEKPKEEEQTDPPVQEGEENEEEEKDDEKPDVNEDKKDDTQDEDGMWEEYFKEHRDSKPRGPSSVSLDISFPGVEHVYGIPEHADSLALKSTDGGEPYRLYNLDVFEYELYNPMALYGSIPVMVAHSEQRTVGVFMMNSAEMWIDISTVSAKKTVLNSLMSFFKSEEEVPQVDTHWIAESGIIDVFIMLGPKPHDVFQQYAALTGTTAMPPLFAISYHQCRWNYNDEDDVKHVDSKFDDHDIPYDVLWLDIEHTDGKKYFTWDVSKFPTPQAMQDNLAAKGRKMVTIIDPHIKREDGYHIHQEANEKNYYVRNRDGDVYEGWCWPGSSSWIDFTNPEIRSWWSSKFHPDQYQGSTSSLFTWNDMNEPSVFNGPEITMHKDALHYGDWEHRDIHNIYGMYQHMATRQGLTDKSSGNVRPFVLSRAFFAGTQRFGAIWTGDNTADWDHLKISIPMLLSLNVAGLPFSGADVGGFFKNPESELLVRWYQAASYTPFFRAHAHLDTKRREPWLSEEQDKLIIRDAVRRRYALLPFWYTLFHDSSVTGTPMMRPLWVEYPKDKKTFGMDDQYLLGKNLLIKPVTTKGQTSIDVYLPGENELWYDEKKTVHKGGESISVDTPLTKIPIFQRGGSIIPFKYRVRRSSSLMIDDPYTLVIALDLQGSAEGYLYVDDGYSFDYKQGTFLYRKFSYSNNQLKAEIASEGRYNSLSGIERIVVAGIANAPRGVYLRKDGGEETGLNGTYDPSSHVLQIKKPPVNIADTWTIHVRFQ